MANMNFNTPVKRYIYLAQDANDINRLGGNPNKVFSTAQAAYDAANALQITSGGLVELKVMNITSVAAGDITIAAGQNWNSSVILSGIDTTISNIGNIINSNTTHTISLTAFNLSIGSINGDVSGGGGNAVNITLNLTNVITGIVSSNATSGNGGNISITGVNTTISSISGTGSALANGSIISINGSIINLGTVNNTGGANSGTFTANVISGTIGAITSNGGGGGSGAITITGSSLQVGAISSTGSTNNSGSFVTITSNTTAGIEISSITSTGNGTGEGGAITLSGTVQRTQVNISSIGGASAGCGFVHILSNWSNRQAAGTGLPNNLNVVQTKNGNSADSTLVIIDSEVHNITQNNNSNSAFAAVTITNSLINGSYVRNGDTGATNVGGWGTGNIKNTIFTDGGLGGAINFSTIAPTTNLIGTMLLDDVKLNNGNLAINHFGASGSLGTLSINDSLIVGTTSITYATITTPGTYTWSRNRFTGNVTLSSSGSTLNTYILTGNIIQGSLIIDGTKTININGGSCKAIVNSSGTFTLNAKNTMITNIDRIDTGEISEVTMGVNEDGSLNAHCINNIDGNGLEFYLCTFRSSGTTLDAAAPQTVNIAADAASNFLSFFSTAVGVNVTRNALVSA